MKSIKQTQPEKVAEALRIAANDKLDHNIQTCLVFAARYSHDRPTGASLAVVIAIKSNWAKLNESTQQRIIKESHDATCNLFDWSDLRGFASCQP